MIQYYAEVQGAKNVPLRLIEIVIPSKEVETVLDRLEDQDSMGVWIEKVEGEQSLVRVLLQAEQTEAVSDAVSDAVGDAEGFRVMLFEVAATVPQPKEASPPKGAEADPSQRPEEPEPQRISREELYADIADGANLNLIYIANILLATLVAAIGLLNSSVAVIIGAMVIAPLLGPNVALALAVTLGDVDLIVRSLKTTAVAFVCAAFLSLLIGFVFGANPAGAEITPRTTLTIENIVLAVAAGSAGALAFSTGVPTALIGVMVAVALLPPLVTAGLMAGAGYGQAALGAMLLFIANIAGVNLAAVATFFAQGIRPRTWWEAERAKRATRIALAFWFAILAIFVVVLLLFRES